MRRSVGPAAVLALALVAAACSSSTVPGSPPPSASPTAPGAEPIPAVTVEGMRAHLEALQRIADEHGGTRAVGTTGYEASVDHVAAELRDAGYEVELRAVDVPAFEQEAPTILELTEPSERSWVDGTHLRAMLFSASGDVRAPVTAAEGGCDPSDLAGFPRGDVALLDPGPCLRREQVLNAQGAGAAAVIVAYADTAPGRPLRPTLLYPDGIEVPALAVTPGVGDALRAEGAERPTVHIQVSAMSRWTQADSVLAETTTGDPDSVVMLGAHLDSVIDGPGINDDGSGVAMLLEIARWMSTREADATVRFAFWAGEEEGLYGSREYVDALPEAERGAIVAYLNLDMVGSPNSVPYVIADQPADPAAAETTATIRELFTSWFEAAGLSTEPIDLHGGADHGPFAQAGIPVGGMHSGSSEIKTAVQAEANGGDAGQPMDACYHQACDTSANVSDVVMERFAAAYVQVLTVLAEVDASA